MTWACGHTRARTHVHTHTDSITVIGETAQFTAGLLVKMEGNGWTGGGNLKLHCNRACRCLWTTNDGVPGKT